MAWTAWSSVVEAVSMCHGQCFTTLDRILIPELVRGNSGCTKVIPYDQGMIPNALKIQLFW